LRRRFEMAGAFEPTLVINHRIKALFDIAQRTGRVGTNFFEFGASVADLIEPSEVPDFTVPRRKWNYWRMSLVRSHLA
jgi:hypothetical protein